MLFSRKNQEIILLHNKILQKYSVAQDKPILLYSFVFDETVEIRWIDEEHFLLIIPLKFLLEIRSWQQPENCVQSFVIPIQESQVLTDAIFLSSQKSIIAGGGWDNLYFTDIHSKSVSHLFTKEEHAYLDYIAYLTTDNKNKYLIYSNIDQFNYFVLAKISEKNKVLPFTTFRGDVRNHLDKIVFLNSEDSFVHVYMNLYGMQVVKCYRIDNNTLHLEWQHTLPVFFYNKTKEAYWESHASANSTSTIVASGQQIFCIDVRGYFKGQIIKHWWWKNLILDLMLIENTLYIFDKEGLHTFDTTTHSSSNLDLFQIQSE